MPPPSCTVMIAPVAEDRRHRLGVHRPAGDRVEVHHVQPLKSLGREFARLRRRIGVEHGDPVHVAAHQPDALARPSGRWRENAGSCAGLQWPRAGAARLGSWRQLLGVVAAADDLATQPWRNSDCCPTGLKPMSSYSFDRRRLGFAHVEIEEIEAGLARRLLDRRHQPARQPMAARPFRDEMRGQVDAANGLRLVVARRRSPAAPRPPITPSSPAISARAQAPAARLSSSAPSRRAAAAFQPAEPTAIDDRGLCRVAQVGARSLPRNSRNRSTTGGFSCCSRSPERENYRSAAAR